MKTLVSILLIIALLACSSNPYRLTNKSYRKQVKTYSKFLAKNPILDTLNYQKPAYWVGTTNFNLRKPNYVVIHHTAQTGCDQTLKTFTLPRTQVSSHYVICEDGTVHHMLHDYLRAWHAGSGKWGAVSDLNSASIGIELDNDGTEPFKSKQMESLMTLLAGLKKNHSIPASNFIGHADLAPTRKNDPSIQFDWKNLADNGFGLWYGDTSKIAIPQGFDANIAFRIIGYHSPDSSAVVNTFKRKYLKTEKTNTLSLADKKVLYALMLAHLKN